MATFGDDKPLGGLVREIVGLDRTAAKEAFAEFLSRGNLTADQITFIDQIVDHLAQNGTMDPRLLYQPPFNDVHDHGVNGVWPQDAQSIVRTLERIKQNTLVA